MKILVYLNFVITIFLVAGFTWIVTSTSALRKNVNPQDSIEISDLVDTSNGIDDTQTQDDNCGEVCKEEIKNQVEKAVSNFTPQKTEIKTVLVTPASQSKALQVSYIPISGPLNTTSTDWYDAPGTDFNLNIADYGKSAYTTWDVSLKVAHGNGTAYARLFDVTHGIAVIGSEVSLSNNSTLTQVSSGRLNFWSGNNLYRVQIKSLNSFEVTFGSGRVKINY